MRGRLPVRVLVAALLLAVGATYVWMDRNEDVAKWAIVIAGAIGAVLAVLAIVVFFLNRRGGGGGARTLIAGVLGVAGVAFLFVMLPKFACGCGEGPRAAAARSDLNSLLLAEQAYFADHHRYAGRAGIDSEYYAPSSLDSVEVTGDSGGFRATARNISVGDVICGLWIGTPPADGMHGAKAGQPACWQP